MQKHKAHILLKEKLEKQGFSKIESPMYNDSSYFVKQNGRAKIYVIAGEMTQPDKFGGLGSWIGLDDIEIPINSLLKKYDIEIGYNFFHTINFNHITDGKIPKEYTSMIDNVYLTDDNTIKSVIDYMLHFIDTVYKPLWEKYSDLQVINDELIEKIPMDKLNEYISGTFFHGKILIIMKKCNNPRYEEFYRKELLSFQESANDEGIKETLRSFKQDPELFSKHFLMFQDLYEGLESGKYLEIDDTSDIEIVQSKVVEVKKTKK